MTASLPFSDAVARLGGAEGKMAFNKEATAQAGPRKGLRDEYILEEGSTIDAEIQSEKKGGHVAFFIARHPNDPQSAKDTAHEMKDLMENLPGGGMHVSVLYPSLEEQEEDYGNFYGSLKETSVMIFSHGKHPGNLSLEQMRFGGAQAIYNKYNKTYGDVHNVKPSSAEPPPFSHEHN